MANARNAIGIIALSVVSIAFASAFLYARQPTFVASAASLAPRVGSFDRIQLDGAFTTTISVGKSPHVRIDGDADDVRDVTTSVENGTLTVGERNRPYGARNVVVAIAVPHLRSFANGGAGSTTIRGIDDDVEIDNTGAGSIDAYGQARHETVSLDGVGKIDTQGIEAQDVSVESDGVGAVYVRGNGTLSLTVNGVGEIRYSGHPAHVEQHVNGIGSIGPT